MILAIPEDHRPDQVSPPAGAGSHPGDAGRVQRAQGRLGGLSKGSPGALMSERKPEELVTPELLDGACLLCSEDTAEHCHRRLVAEWLKEKLAV